MQKENISLWLKTLPNKLTLARICVIPLLLLLYPFDVQFLRVFCAVLFAVGALTDYFDGYLARKYQGETRMGAVLDPISDKILVSSAIILLVSTQQLAAWTAALIICRDIAVSGLRLASYEFKFTIEVSQLGKYKTAVQDLAIVFIMLSFSDLYSWGMVLLWISIGFSYFSAYQYWRVFWEKSRAASAEPSQQPSELENS